MTKVFGILGWPVWHSASPIMQTAAFREMKIDATYLRFPVRPGRLEEAVRGLAALGIRGANVTLPHKRAVLAHMDRLDSTAEAIGAVNTIVVERGKLIGYNTDASGLVGALMEAGCDPSGGRAIVVGAGGAARAAVYGLAKAGAKEISVVARRKERAEELVQSLGRFRRISAKAYELGKVPKVRFKEASLFIQGTSATLDDGPAAAAFARKLPLDLLPKSATVTDLVYTPRNTIVIKRAKKLGLTTVDGFGMLVHQGATAFELWTKKKAPIEVMRASLE